MAGKREGILIIFCVGFLNGSRGNEVHINTWGERKEKIGRRRRRRRSHNLCNIDKEAVFKCVLCGL